MLKLLKLTPWVICIAYIGFSYLQHNHNGAHSKAHSAHMHYNSAATR